MKITPESTITMPDGTVHTAAKVKIYDCVGQLIPYAVAYDTVTQEVTILLNVRKDENQKLGGFALTETREYGALGNRVLATFTGVVKGSYVEVNGERFLGL